MTQKRRSTRPGVHPRHARLSHTWPLLLPLLLAGLGSGCGKGDDSDPAEPPEAGSSETVDGSSGAPAVSGAEPTALAAIDGGRSGEPRPIIAARGLYVVVRDRPDKRGARKLGYLRLGGVVRRAAEPAGSKRCPGDWYAIEPRGYACVDADATLDPDHPVVRAASRRPDLSKPMPYAYGFVRSVTPMYLRIPTKDEQLDAEFKLEEHLDWWKSKGHEYNEVSERFANDVALDRLPESEREGRGLRYAADMTEGQLFGAVSDGDPPPWWLEDGRKIPNVARFKVPPTAVFADRARRFTGLAFVGSFAAGEASFNRRFAITEDLRLVPVTKVKPDGGSPFHGVEISAGDQLPFAWVRKKSAKLYQVDGDEAKALDQRPEYRSTVKLAGEKRFIGKRLYYQLEGGKWIRAKSIGIVAEPEDKPKAAQRGEKWIDVSIRQQVLTLWEGEVPVYATLVSTGQDMLGDPKTSKSTVRGTFRVQNKHVTRTMDSDEGLSRDSGDDEYGKTKRRGQGSYRLDHVPWVQYFKGSYALHATHWHDVFGTPRSHGCINLAPVDAHRVFFWTEPAVPEGWHGVYADDAHPGTIVHIHE